MISAANGNIRAGNGVGHRNHNPRMTTSRIHKILRTSCGIILLCTHFANGFVPISKRRGKGHVGLPLFERLTNQCSNHPSHVLRESDDDGDRSPRKRFSMDEVPLNQIFQKAVVLQRSGDRSGALYEYEQFLKVAQSHDVDPSLYAEVHANMGAICAMQGKGTDSNTISHEQKAATRIKAKEAFMEAVKYRPSLGSAWVNLALLLLAEGKDVGTITDANLSQKEQSTTVESILKEARQCCERALGMDNEDERSRALANKLIGDIDSMMRQSK